MRNRDRIPARGRASRVLAKNVLAGDLFLLSGDRRGTVVRNNVRYREDGVGYANILVEVPESGKTFRRRVATSTRIAIWETPSNRKQRRRMARRGENRPNYTFPR